VKSGGPGLPETKVGGLGHVAHRFRHLRLNYVYNCNCFITVCNQMVTVTLYRFTG